MADHALMNGDGPAESAFDEILHAVMAQPLGEAFAEVRASIGPVEDRVRSLSQHVDEAKRATERVEQLMASHPAHPPRPVPHRGMRPPDHVELAEAIRDVNRELQAMQHQLDHRLSAVTRWCRCVLLLTAVTCPVVVALLLTLLVGI